MANTPGKLTTDQTVSSAVAGKQDVLVSGANIKTINGMSILGAGDITVTVSTIIIPSYAGSPGSPVDGEIWLDTTA